METRRKRRWTYEKLSLILTGNLSNGWGEGQYIIWSWQDGRSLLHKFINEDPRRSKDIFRRLLYASPCLVINVRSGSVFSKERWSAPLEARLALCGDIAFECEPSLLSLLEETTSVIEARIFKDNFDRNGLADLVDVLAKVTVENACEWAEQLIEKSLEGLLAGAIWADDLRPLCRIVESHPKKFPAERMTRVADAIAEVAKSIASGDIDLKPDALREEAEALEALAKTVTLDIKSEVTSIRERADELEQDSLSKDDDVKYSSSSSSEDNDGDDEEIASIFSTLNV